MLPYTSFELAKARQRELIAEADHARLAAQARAHAAEGKAAPWESVVGRVRHVFAVFSALPPNPDVHLGRTATRP